MLKKIFCAIAFVATIYFATVFLVINAASSQDVWIDTQNGKDCYVMTETFVDRTQYRDNRTFNVKLKFVGASVDVHEYSFRENDGIIWYSIDGGESKPVGNDELVKKIWEFGLNFLNIDYEAN